MNVRRFFRRAPREEPYRRKLECGVCGTGFISPALTTKEWEMELIFTCPQKHSSLYGNVRIRQWEDAE